MRIDDAISAISTGGASGLGFAEAVGRHALIDRENEKGAQAVTELGTPMVKAMSDEIQEALAAGIAHLARLADGDEYAKIALHIIENDFLNGSVIRLDDAARLNMR